MDRWKKVAVAVLSAILCVVGCDGGGGGGSRPGDGNIILSGRVLNNHTDEDLADRGVAGARIVLVNAADVASVQSVSPLEDLATGTHPYPAVPSGSDGTYAFTANDFSDAYPADGQYYVFVDPGETSGIELLPGATASRASLVLNEASTVQQDIILSDQNGSDAAYIGSQICLICHPQQRRIRHSLHFVGVRKMGADGTIINDLMDFSDTSVYDLQANNDEMLNKFTDPATQYRLADDPARSVWLGRDETGLYFQLTSEANPKFYVKLTYGGESGSWRGLFMTTINAGSGTYAQKHGVNGDDYAYYTIAPFQYNEDPITISGEQFVAFHPERWDFEGSLNSGFTADVASASYDLQCAACHGATRIETVNFGMTHARKVAVYPEDDDGYAIDGRSVQINVGCEKCHGPGSKHIAASGRGRWIVAPDKLPPGRATMICGACHIRGENDTDIGGGVPLIADGMGNYETFKPGMSPARFFGSADGTGRNISPFGTVQIAALTSNGYLEPANFEENSEASWIDRVFGAEFNHSKAFRQHYQDLVRNVKFSNEREILTCGGCHDPHGSPYDHMVRHSADNNAVCLGCHNGPGQVFSNVSDRMIERLQIGRASQADVKAIGNDVEAHIYNKTGTLQMAPYDPEGTAMGRCTLCHMSKTARSADWRLALKTNLGRYIGGDITSHTFDVMATEAVNAMSAARGVKDTTPAGISHECGPCHAFAGLN